MALVKPQGLHAFIGDEKSAKHPRRGADGRRTRDLDLERSHLIHFEQKRSTLELVRAIEHRLVPPIHLLTLFDDTMVSAWNLHLAPGVMIVH
jgi:hypothetical protein